MVVVLPDQVFVRAQQTNELTIESQNDEELPQQETTLRPWVNAHNLQQAEGTWYKDGRRVVTGDVDQRRLIIQRHHDPPIHGHLGISCTVRLVERDYWWPQLRMDVMEYVKGCVECQRNKVNTRPTRAPLAPITPKPDATPFEVIALDFITKLPKS